MHKCDTCNKEFDNYRALNGHKRLHGVSGGHYSVSRKTTKRIMFSCLNCGKESTYNPKCSHGKYCSIECQILYRWNNIEKPKILSGHGGNLKKYLTEKYGYKCSRCGISDWNGEPLSLHLDHIDGDSDNNQVVNVRLLCPNCHSQTVTYVARNKKNAKRNRYLQRYKAEKRQK